MTEDKIATGKSLPISESHGALLEKDIKVWDQLESLIQENEHGFKHVLELWPVYVRRLHMLRFLAHYELFKQVIELPGHIVELGVSRGVSFFTWSKLMEIFCSGDRSRRVFGFDSFQGLQNFNEKDGKLDPNIGKVEGGWSAGAVQEEVEILVKITNLDNMIPSPPSRPRCELIIGDVKETLPKFLKDNPGLRISLLHFDVDLYEPTKIALELLYPLVVKGGLVVLDEYGLIPWQGESEAVEEYFQKMGNLPVIKKFPFTATPGGYFVK